ncbi:hypothetical protein [Nocardioides terrisoli]|uniref:hypothetical protein n=1 Tax=Nocardioides terrisoli TaxID=3388267 RepID=UPI00287B8705|nr:hypothetical protein [Nocardioides marmorisolisilvae]
MPFQPFPPGKAGGPLLIGKPGPAGPTGPEGRQGPPGPGTGAGAWQPTTAYTAAQVVQAPDGSMIRRVADGTSRASFDATEQAAWTAVLASSGTVENDALTATFARKSILPAARATADGHSYMNGVGTGVTKGTNDMATLIAAGLDLPLFNRAIAGSVLYSHLGTGDDWAQVLQNETRPTRFAPPGGFYPIMWGINDAHALGNTQTAQAPFKQALRSVISRYRSGAVFESSDSTVTLGGSGTWLQSLTAISNSGVGFHYNPTAGGTITITTPASFPGGTIALGFINWDDSSAFTVTGPASLGSPVLTPTPTDGTYRSPAVMRIADVPAGSASYVFTTSAVTGGVGCAFDFWAWEPDEESCPLIVFVGQAKPLDYTQYGDSNLTDAGVDALNAVSQAVVAEFGSRVIYVPTTDMDHSTTYYEAGNIHPNAAGHAHIADLVVAAVQDQQLSFLRADLNIGPLPASASTPLWVSYTPTLTGAGTTQGNATVLGAYQEDTQKHVAFYARVTLGSTSVVGTIMEISLPVAAIGASNGIVVFDGMVNRGAGTTLFRLACRIQSSTSSVRLCVIGTNGALSNAGATTPLTWASGDVITIGGVYRAA